MSRMVMWMLFMKHSYRSFNIVWMVVSIVVTVDATHRPVEFFHLHAGIADYFHHGGRRFQNFGLQYEMDNIIGKLVD